MTMTLLLLALLAFIALAAVEAAVSPYGRHRGARRLAPAETDLRASGQRG
ncbi:hypothetical protein ACIRBX_36525 [Kitasatospora sp. NPDC096147]